MLLKGGFCRPSLGAIRSFWFSMGICKEEDEEIFDARSSRVAELGSVNV